VKGGGIMEQQQLNIGTGRNRNDVIMELITLHVQQAAYHGNPVTPEEIQQLFEKYYSLVRNK
jgi:hypothetical protein